MSASIIENAVAEQNATPAQNEKVLKNSDNYKNLNEEESGLLIADINKDKTDNTIDNVSGFKTWQTNPYVAVERPTEETMRTAGVYELTKQDLYKTLAEKYGESLAYKTDVIMGHTRQTGWAPYRAYSAIVNNLNSMRVADTTK